METKEVLKTLSNSFGVSSYEKNTFKVIKDILSKEFEKIKFETVGTDNLLVKFGTGKKKIAFFAHTDEIGVVISKIENEHFARISSIGGVDPRTLVAKRITFFKNGKETIGVVGMLAPHLQNAKTKKISPSFDELFIDFSISGGTKNISVGDVGSIEVEAMELNEKYITGKAIDNRAGVTTIIKALEYLQYYNFDGELYLSFNKGEEVGLVGAKGAAHYIKPDVAIIVDVTFGNDTIPGYETMKINEGPAILIGAAVHKKTYQKLVDIADENNIKYQIEVAPSRSGTETDIVQITNGGVATALLSVPILNMHSPVEVVSINDIEATAKLMAIFAAKEGRCK
ncbi:peptidase M42 [Tepiditoga spiralis]|uniref:Peptidase M42 n=1 Tax=Tepiditoga spiralis TaxID=2108365 RepID=A0A7G1GAI2_9BACT|nr:M28 family peptidase [Tepiditoga spiralis]BBE31152.1 peptidase M42 [Tepiditoga spiralis]